MRPADPNSNSSEISFDLQDYLRKFWAKKFMVLTPMLIATLVAGVGVRFLTPVFESAAVIEVRDKQFLSREVEQQIGRTNTRQRDHDRVILEGIAATITGREFQDVLIRRLALDQLAAMREEADLIRRTEYPQLTTDEILSRRLRRLLTEKSQVRLAGPRLFQISFADQSAENSFVLADAIADLFVELQEKKELEGLRTASEFSDEQIAIYRQTLSRSEQELEEFQKSIAVRGMGNGPVNESNARRAQNLQQQLNIDISEARGIMDKVKRNLQSVASMVPNDQFFNVDDRVQEYQRNLASRREEQLLRALDASNTQNANDTENEQALQRSQAALQRYLNGFVRAHYPDLSLDYLPLVAEYYYQRANVASLEEKSAQLMGHIDDFRSKLSLDPEDERELERLRKEVNTNRDLLESFVRAKAQTRISEAVEHMGLGLTISVLERPERPLAPVRPNKMKIFLLAIAFGGVIGAGTFFVTEYMDSSFTTIDEIEAALDCRVLGTIPALENGPWNRDNSKKKRLVAVAASIVITLLSISGFYFYGKQAAKDTIGLASVEGRQDG